MKTGKSPPTFPGNGGSQLNRVLWNSSLGLSRCEPPGCYRSLSGPSRPKCPWSVPESVPGVRGSVQRGVSGALWAPGSGVFKKCPESVPGVFKKCRDTFWTLWSPGPKGPRRSPAEHSLRRPPFSGTLSGTLRGHFGSEGPRDSCSRPGGSQRVSQECLARDGTLSRRLG